MSGMTTEQQKPPFKQLMDQLIIEYFGYVPGHPDEAQKKAVGACYRRYGRAVRDILDFALQDPQRALNGVHAIERRMNKLGLDWGLDAAARWFPQWNADPGGFENETNRRR